jgi:hypothetical protein
VGIFSQLNVMPDKSLKRALNSNNYLKNKLDGTSLALINSPTAQHSLAGRVNRQDWHSF